MKLRVLAGLDFAECRDKIKKLAGKKPIYSMQSGVSKFSHWEVPTTELGTLLSLIPKERILLQSDKAKSLIASFELESADPATLPPIEDNIDWKIPPKFPQQEEFIRINPSKGRMILAPPPGAGKSFMSITRSKVLNKRKILVICPSKNNYPTWRAEITKFTDYSCMKYHGTPVQRKKLRQALDADVVVTTYTIAHELKDVNFDQIIADEAHNVCHSKTKAFKNLESILKALPNAGVLLLSGTPILHKPRDLWAPVHLLSPAIAGDEWAWQRRYEEVVQSIQKKVPIRQGSSYAVDENGKIKTRLIEIPLVVRNRNLDELAERIRPLMYRFKLDKELAFEDRVEIQRVEMTPRQRELYNQARSDLHLELSTGQLKLAKEKLGRITRFLQIAEGAFNLDENLLESGKYAYLFDELDAARDKRIVWSRFLPGSKILYERYKDKAVLYNGEMTQIQRNLAIWNFQGCENEADLAEWRKYNKNPNFTEPGQALFLFGVIDRGASAGLNLHSCSKQYFTSFSYNGSINEQTAARIKRLSQEAPEVYTEIILSETPNNFEEAAFQLSLKNFAITLDILDGKEDNSYRRVNDLIKLL